jgi:hypothetical protein
VGAADGRQVENLGEKDEDDRITRRRTMPITTAFIHVLKGIMKGSFYCSSAL